MANAEADSILSYSSRRINKKFESRLQQPPFKKPCYSIVYSRLLP
jgi:hypothetical protein